MMDEKELEHRLTDVENRSKSNTHRIDQLEKLTDAVNDQSKAIMEMSGSLNLTVQELKHTNSNMERISVESARRDKRIEALEKAPGAFSNKVLWAVCAGGIGALVAWFMAAILPHVA